MRQIWLLNLNSVTLVLQYTSVSVCLSACLLIYYSIYTIILSVLYVLTCSRTDFSFRQFSVSRTMLARQDSVDCRGSTA